MPTISEREAVRRAWDRLGFGLPPRESRGSNDFDSTVRVLLRGASRGDPGVAATPIPTLSPPVRQDDDANEKRQAARRLAVGRANRAALTGWWLRRMAAAREPLPERMTWFWHGHFATSFSGVSDARLMARQNVTMRERGLGSFRALARAMIVDPAMLVWLDGDQNTAEAPNENLSREFLELFSLGPGHYGEADVLEGARALSGWVLERNRRRDARLVDDRHDTGMKTILGVTDRFGAVEFVDVALDQPASPTFVVGRLWTRLVSPTPPDPETMQNLLSAYGDDGDIRAVVAAITDSPAFIDTASGLIKQPVEWFVGMIRSLGADENTLDSDVLTRAISSLRALGQTPFDPPSVGGWPQGRSWLTSSTAATRLSMARTIVTALRSGRSVTAASTAGRVREAAEVFGIDRWSPATVDALTAVADDPDTLLAVAAISPEYVVSR